MKFYNREEELAVLDNLIVKSKKQAQMTMVSLEDL